MTCQRPQYGKHVTRYQLGDRSRVSIVSWLRDKAKAQVPRRLSHSQPNDVAHCWNCLTVPGCVMNRAYSMGGCVENHEEICLVIIAIFVTPLWRPKGKIITETRTMTRLSLVVEVVAVFSSATVSTPVLGSSLHSVHWLVGRKGAGYWSWAFI